MLDPKAIEDAYSTYYSTLYNLKDETSLVHPDSFTIQTFLVSVHLPCLSPVQLECPNVPFMTSEVCKALDSLPNNKSPGQDGFVGEYYKQFQSILIEHIILTVYLLLLPQLHSCKKY